MRRTKQIDLGYRFYTFETATRFSNGKIDRLNDSGSNVSIILASMIYLASHSCKIFSTQTVVVTVIWLDQNIFVSSTYSINITTLFLSIYIQVISVAS